MEPITTTELEAVEYRKVTKIWTYEELMDIFDESSLVIQLIKRCQRLESALAAARAEIERLRGYGTLDIDKLIADRTELTALRRQIDGAAVLSVEWVSGYPAYEGLPDGEPGEKMTYKLLEVKP